MKSFSVVLLSLPFALTLSLAALGAEPSNATNRARPNLVTVQSQAPAPNVNAGLVGDVEKMLHGGADAAVVKAYIQNWTGRYYVTADQILHLHDVGANTEVLTALIQRSGELRAQSTPAPAPAPNLVTANPAPAQVVDETPPAVVYPYPATYPAYTYSYLYPSIYPSYSYWWSVPYSYSYSYWPWYRGYGWGGYRYYGWNRGPYYRYPYSHGYAWGRPGHPGYNGSWRGGGGYTHAIGSRPGGWNGGGFRGGVGVGVGVGHGGGFRGGGGGGFHGGGGGGGRH